MIRRTQFVLAIGAAVVSSFAVQPIGKARSVPLDSYNQDQSVPEWQRYIVKGEEFSVLLPTVPAMKTETHRIEGTNHERRERVLGAYENGVVYVVYTSERKGQTLDDLIHDFANHKYTAVQLQDVSVSGIAGKQYRFEDDERVLTIQFFATRKNFYVFQASGSQVGNPKVGIPKFFSSLTFQKDAEARNVIDGPGEQAGLRAERQEDATVLSDKEVTRKSVVIIKPEPTYTLEARKNRIVGRVVLRLVFSSSGAVTSIHAVSSLPEGLTERAMEAARQIRFIPAIKDGRFVSTWIELQYNFNVY